MPENSLFSSSRQKNGIRSINSRYTLLPSLGVQLSGEVPFVISEWLVWELPPDNQRVSNSLFERSPIIIVVGFLIPQKSWIRVNTRRRILEFAGLVLRLLHCSERIRVTGTCWKVLDILRGCENCSAVIIISSVRRLKN